MQRFYMMLCKSLVEVLPTDFENRHTEARVRGVTLNGAALTNMRNNVIGKLPTDLTIFEAYVRNYPIRDTGGDTPVLHELEESLLHGLKLCSLTLQLHIFYFLTTKYCYIFDV